MKKMSAYIKEHKLGYLAAIAAMVISIVLDMLSPQLMKQIIDDVILGGEVHKLTALLLGILGVGTGRALFQYVKEFLFDVIGSKIACDMRSRLFTHIQGLSASFFDKTGTGELMARVKDDIDRIWEALTFIVMLMIEVIIHSSIVLYCMFRLSPSLALLPAACMVLCGTIALVMERKLGLIYMQISEENAALNTVAEENLEGVRTVKSFAREKFEIKKFLSHNHRYYELNMKQSKVFIRYFPYFRVISKLLPLAVLLLGGYQVIDGRLTLGSLGAFLEYSNNIVWPMEMLGWLTNGLSAAKASSKKISKIYQEAPEIRDPQNPVLLPAIQGAIRFDDVSFHKEDQYEILKHISFAAKPGETIGIMGATGAGKSSIVHLLQRMYDATDGSILIDGIDIRSLPLTKLRSSISVVMQDVFLFSDTILDNVALGRKGEIHLPDIKQASRSAQASAFIEQMSDQYETIIGERGIGLSGGQKQRISIARALARNNPILVLDDSTSALDMETEYSIQEALKGLKDTTKLVIAHRISAVRNADQILVLEDGEITERGTHESLMKQKGLYYQTYLSQYGELGKEA